MGEKTPRYVCMHACMYCMADNAVPRTVRTESWAYGILPYIILSSATLCRSEARGKAAKLEMQDMVGLIHLDLCAGVLLG